MRARSLIKIKMDNCSRAVPANQNKWSKPLCTAAHCAPWLVHRSRSPSLSATVRIKSITLTTAFTKAVAATTTTAAAAPTTTRSTATTATTRTPGAATSAASVAITPSTTIATSTSVAATTTSSTPAASSCATSTTTTTRCDSYVHCLVLTLPFVKNLVELYSHSNLKTLGPEILDVHEDVFAVIASDEAETLLVKPLLDLAGQGHKLPRRN
mmetsp:Transcript_18406/g.49450  ORF Transcript_18406/g.49450 Transcript_18406/m.49450 type:complete len:212 (-) Transcript_18406:49-684(-)